MHAERRKYSFVDWNDDRIAALKRWWSEGLTASQIARRMGGISRNAVIGKVSRLGLPRRMDGKPGSHRVYVRPSKQWHKNVRAALSEAGGMAWQKPRLPRQAGRLTQGITPRVRYRPEVPPEPVVIHEDVYVAPEARKGVLQLTESDCKWPIGDPREADFHFCGGPRVPGLPYCEGHCKRAYQTVQEIDARKARAMRAA